MIFKATRSLVIHWHPKLLFMASQISISRKLVFSSYRIHSRWNCWHSACGRLFELLAEFLYAMRPIKPWCIRDNERQVTRVIITCYCTTFRRNDARSRLDYVQINSVFCLFTRLYETMIFKDIMWCAVDCDVFAQNRTNCWSKVCFLFSWHSVLGFTWV